MRAVKVMLVCAVAALLLGACSTPCDGPGPAWPDRLCAPVTSITSGPPPEDAAPAVRTFAVASPDIITDAAAGALPAAERKLRIGLLLPLRSETLGLASYTLAVDQNDIVVGPLARSAVNAEQVRQLRSALGNDTTIYGTSSLNPGTGPGAPDPELDGVRLLDLPWQVQRDHPAVMVYPRLLPGDAGQANADMQRLYALGIDAFRVAREIALHPASAFQLDGVSGRLAVSFGRGPARFERTEQGATYRNGALVALPGPRQHDAAAPP